MNEFKEKFSYNFKTAISEGECHRKMQMLVSAIGWCRVVALPV
jgi:hypothetical protein